jgi:drug/metabolite transporter (DMT)-like permease
MEAEECLGWMLIVCGILGILCMIILTFFFFNEFSSSVYGTIIGLGLIIFFLGMIFINSIITKTAPDFITKKFNICMGRDKNETNK